MRHYKSPVGAKSTIKNVSGLPRFSHDFRSGDKVAIARKTSSVLLRDYLDQAASIGCAVPATVRHSLGRWATSLQIDWPWGAR